jgi:hypothetical protein
VFGLDRDAAYVVEVVREPEPAEYDPTAHYPQPLDPVVSITDPDSEDVNGTVTYGWELVELSPPPPSTNWEQFRQAILTENGYVAAHCAAMASSTPTVRFAAMALFTALGDFQYRGIYNEYLQALTLTISELPAADKAHLVEEFIALSQRCNIPVDFIAAFAAIMQPHEPD